LTAAITGCFEQETQRRAGAHGREAARQPLQPKRDRVDQKSQAEILGCFLRARIYFEVISKVGGA
jgi:hypothetical protein